MAKGATTKSGKLTWTPSSMHTKKNRSKSHVGIFMENPAYI